MRVFCLRLSLTAVLSLVFVQAELWAQPFKHKLYDPTYNVFDVIAEADAWFATNGTGPGKGYKTYQRWKYEAERRFYPSGDRMNFDPTLAAREYSAFKATQMRGGSPGYWRFMGPDRANQILPPSWAAGVGRIEAAWAGYTTADTVYLGSRSGGFWKTTDQGSTWRSTTQDQPALGVVDIAVKPGSPNEVWILTRHAVGYSYGLLKSLDYGETWQTSGLSFAAGAAYASQLWIPTPDTLYVSTNGGIQRSTDGGNNFTQVYGGNMMWVTVHPTNSQILYAFDSNSSTALHKSTDGGQNWTTVTVTGNVGYSMMSVSHSEPNSIWVASNSGIRKSTDLGSTWTQLSTDPTNSGIMAFSVSDTDPLKLFAGSLNHYVSSDGGATWSVLADWVNYFGANYMHADGRVFRTYGNRMLLGTDGFLGLSSDNGTTWTKVNEVGTGVREFYRIGCTPMQIDRAVGGSQDNGTSAMIDGEWKEWIGADGMQAHFDGNNPDIWFGTIQNGSLQLSTQAGQNASGIAPSTNGAWITPSVIDPSNENTIFIAYDSVYKSNDNGATWQRLSGLPGNQEEIAIAPSDSNYLYISRGTRLRRSTNNGLTWSFADSGLPNQYITRIAVDPNDPLHVCVSFSGTFNGSKVFRSTNGGTSWANITHNLPNLPANALAWTEGPPKRLFLGMDVGVYYLDAGTSNWVLYADSLPAVVINDIEVLEGAGLIRVATWGRGMWEAPLPGRAGKPQIIAVALDPEPVQNRPTPADSVLVTAAITQGAQTTGVLLRWGTDGISFPNSIPMSATVGDTFQATQHIPAQPAGTRVYMRIIVQLPASDSIQGDRIMYRVGPPYLCEATGSQGTSFDFIDTVAIGGMVHASAQDYYGDFRQVYATLYRDSTYQLMTSLNYSFVLDTMFAWIDWNNNGFVQEPGEQLIMSNIDAAHNSYATVTVPHLTQIPDTVTMRVRVIYGSNPVADPCDSYFGEVEDYSIVITDPNLVGLATDISQGFSIYPNPSGGTFITRAPTDGGWNKVEVLDLMGRVLWNGEVASGGTVSVTIAGQPEGMYLVRWENADGNQVSLPWILMRP